MWGSRTLSVRRSPPPSGLGTELVRIFEQFPKVRSELSPAMAKIYKQHYRENREGQTPASSLAQRMEAWLHRQVASDLTASSATGGTEDGRKRTTLELGAGTLNQLQHEPERGPYDIVEPFSELFEESPRLTRIRNVYRDVSEVPSDAIYDRITSVATFEHICNLPEVIARSGLLLAKGGTLRASIPSEGTFLWTLGWKLTTGIEFRRRYGMDYGTLMRHEHVNDAEEIEDLLRHFFREVHGKVFALSRSVSLYQFYACSDPDLARCRAYIDSIAI